MDAQQPHNIEAEQAVLGAILTNPETLDDAIFLKSADFFLVRHQWIWAAANRLSKQKQSIDFLTMSHALEEAGRLKELGGAAYLLELIQRTPSTLNIESYARIVQDLSVRRELLRVASSIAALAHQSETPIAEVVSRARDLAETPQEALSHGRRTSQTMYEAAGELLQDASLWAETPNQIRGITCGEPFTPIAEISQGFHRRLLAFIAGRPGMGKSAALAQMAVSFANEGKRTVIFSLEMSHKMLFMRMACQLARVDANKLWAGTLPRKQWEDFVRATDYLSTLDGLLTIDDSTGLTVREIAARTKHIQRSTGIDIVMVDTLNRLGDVGKGKDQYHGVTNASHALKDFAHANHFVVIAAVQMNRANAQLRDPRPQLHHLKDSGAIEEDADLIWGLHRPYYYDKGLTEMRNLSIWYPLKMRYGRTDQPVELFWQPNWPGFARLQRTNVDTDII